MKGSMKLEFKLKQYRRHQSTMGGGILTTSRGGEREYKQIETSSFSPCPD